MSKFDIVEKIINPIQKLFCLSVNEDIHGKVI